MKEGNESKPVVYIPSGAKINVENSNDTPPSTKYDHRKVIFDLDKVKKIVRGIYGKRND